MKKLFEFAKKAISIYLFIIQAIFFKLAKALALAIKFIFRMDRFPTFAVHRIADILFMVVTGLWVLFLMQEFHFPTWPTLLTQNTLCFLMGFSAVGFFTILIARLFNHQERKQIMQGTLARNDKRRLFPDGWAFDDITIRLWAGAGWGATSVLTLYMLAICYFQQDVSISKMALYLVQNFVTGLYLPANTLQLPELFSHLSSAFQWTLTALVISGAAAHIMIYHEINSAWKELFDNQELPEERVIGVITTISGAPPIWKRRLLSMMFKGQQPEWKMRRAIRLAKYLEVDHFATEFLVSLKDGKEWSEDMKARSLKTIIWMLEKKSDIFDPCIRQKIVIYANDIDLKSETQNVKELFAQMLTLAKI